MKERDGKYTVDGLLCSVLKTVTVMVVVSQKGAVLGLSGSDQSEWLKMSGDDKDGSVKKGSILRSAKVGRSARRCRAL